MSNLIDDVATYLQANSIGTVGTNIFEGLLPASPDIAVAIIETSGGTPDVDIPNRKPTFQILVRNTDYGLGRTVCDNIRLLLHNKYNLNFVVGSSIYVYYCQLTAEGGHIGQDKNGRDLFSMNFQCNTRQPSQDGN